MCVFTILFISITLKTRAVANGSKRLLVATKKEIVTFQNVKLFFLIFLLPCPILIKQLYGFEWLK